MPYRIVPIVEGRGDVTALPVLLRRLLAQINPPVAIDVARPIPRPRGRLLKAGGIEAAVELAANEMGQVGAVLLLVDSDGDCPREQGPAIANRAKDARKDKRISVVLAHQEYEAWFLASASSLRGVRGLSPMMTDHHDPESVRGCKEWLEGWLPPTSRYSETADQAALTSSFDIALARRAPSFDKLWREVEGICQHARSLEQA